MNAIIASANTVWQDSRGRTVVLVSAAILIGIVFAFWFGFADLWKRWTQNEELSHSPILPLVSAWMLWERRDALRQSVGSPASIGLVAAAGSLFVLFMGVFTGIEVLMHLGLVGVIGSLPLALGGWSLFWITLVPIAYLLFAVPPPPWVVTVLSGKFQLWSSELGVAAARALGGTVGLTGNVIRLPNATLQVVEACSGLNYLFPFLGLGALAAYFYKGPLWQRGLIFLSTIPITILMNSFRIAVTCWLVENHGEQHTEGALHFFEGWVVFVMCIGLLLGIIYVLTLLRGRRGLMTFIGFEDVPPRRPTGTWTQAAFVRNGFVFTALLLIGGVMVHVVGNRAMLVPERLDFATFSFEFDDMLAREQALSEGMEIALAADDYLIADFVPRDAGPRTPPVNFYAAYLDKLRGDSTWHSPSQCLPGGGWEIASHTIEEVEHPAGGTYAHNRMLIQQEDNRMLVYYWYDQRGRQVADEFIMKYWVLVDSITRQRSDGAMVRLMTHVGQGESLEEAEARLDGMRRRVLGVLPAYVPA